MARPLMGRPAPVSRPAANLSRAPRRSRPPGGTPPPARPSAPPGGRNVPASAAPKTADARTGRLAIAAWAAVGLLWLAAVGLFAIGLRPVRQTVTETVFRAPAEPPVEVGPPPREAGEPAAPVPDNLALGEARPLSADVLARLPADARPDPDPDDAGPAPACERFGTKIDFVRSQSAAFRQASRDRKLVMVLHLAGNFEDPGFT